MWVKALVLFSCAGLYYYPVISRTYALLGLTLCLTAVLYPVRFKRPFLYGMSILLILYIHSYLAGLAGILSVFFITECFIHYRRYGSVKRFYGLFAALFLAAGAFACYLMVADCVGASSVVPRSWKVILQNNRPADWIRTVINMAHLHGIAFFREAGAVCTLILYWGCTGTVLVCLWIGKRWKQVVIWLCAVIWMMLMNILIYPMVMHRAYLPFLLLLFVWALGPLRGRGDLKGSKNQRCFSISSAVVREFLQS